MLSRSTYKLLVASKIRGIGRRALHDLSTDKIFFQSSPGEFGLALSGVGGQVPSAAAIEAAVRSADGDIETAERRGDHIVGILDPQYPKLLRALEDRPALLFLRGQPEHISEKALAIIGTREPTDQGRTMAERITRYFSENGWQIVSGLAVGLDTVAHEAALDSNGTTVAVLAHGLDKVYPKENAPLAEKIVATGGLLVTEYSYGDPTFPGHFVERDRIQAGLGLGVVMVQSDEAGGSWHASRAALRYGRYLIVPRPTDADLRAGYPKARGNQMIATRSDVDRAQFLKCSVTDLERLVVLKSRDDYPIIEDALLRSAIVSGPASVPQKRSAN